MSTLHGSKRFLISAIFLVISGSAWSADVGVSVSIGQPGFYGQIDIGDYPYPPPRVIYQTPMIVHRQVVPYEPIYLRVPPGHARNWARFCDRYDACDRPAYFIRDDWYHDEYAPVYREHHGGDRGDRGWRGDRDDRDEDRGRGSHGGGHGRGRDW